MTQLPPFSLCIYSPAGNLYEGTIKALTLQNELGPFDVEARHTNFISAVKETVIIYELNGNTRTIPIASGIVKITLNKVEIYVGIEALPDILRK